MYIIIIITALYKQYSPILSFDLFFLVPHLLSFSFYLEFILHYSFSGGVQEAKSIFVSLKILYFTFM